MDNRWLRVVLVTLLYVECGTSDLETDFRVLSKQVTALFEKRTEDVRSIEEHVRRAVLDMPEIANLRGEIKKIRLIQKASPVQTSLKLADKNDAMTVKWLFNAVEELKTEVAEVQDALNSSRVLQDAERTEAQLALMRSDVSNLYVELENARIRNARYEADIQMLKEELKGERAGARTTSEMCGKLKNQLKEAQMEWNQNWRILNEKSPLLENEISSYQSHPPRHQRILRQHVVRLEKSTKTLHKENYSLKSQLLKLQDNVKELEKRLNWKDELETLRKEKQSDNVNESVNTTLNKLMEMQSVQNANITNLTRQMSNFDKLHLSMLELLENVETIENQVDKTLPEFRKEISKLEIQVSESNSAISMFKEDQKNSIDSMKAIGFTVSTMQDKTGEDHEKLIRIDEMVKNLLKSNAIQTSKLHDHILKEESSSINVNATKATINLVQELKSFESEYKSIVNKLPRDCDSVDGPAGLYLISPGDSEPILARCQDGWTTVQQRRDGSVDFNRNWNEYSNGFGSATGEHWLGNANLHRLTAENCSRLQINMRDIYGERWQANYDDFRVADYASGFRLFIDRYHGNASDAFAYQNLMEFSTVDNDRDISNTHCASNYEGGWWFSHCQHANLNGRYNLGLTWFDSTRNEWIAVADSEMRIKRRDVC